MINNVISLIKKAAPSIQKGAGQVGGKVVEHLAKHSKKYITVAGAACTALVAKVAYTFGEKNGEIKGAGNQATKDEEKIQELHEKHEKDRKEWIEEKKGYDEILNDIEDKL